MPIKKAIEYQVIIKTNETDGGLDVSRFVVGGIAADYSPLERESACRQTLGFTIQAQNLGTARPGGESMNPMINPRYRPGAIVEVKLRRNNVFAEPHFGARFVIRQPTYKRHFGFIAQLHFECHCELSDKTERASAYDPYVDVEPYLIGTARSLNDVINLYLLTLELPNLATAFLTATIQTYATYTLEQADSVIDYCHQVAYKNPPEDYKPGVLWMPNNQVPAIALVDMTIEQPYTRVIKTGVWERWATDFEVFENLEDTAAYLPGKVRVYGTGTRAVRRPNPIVRNSSPTTGMSLNRVLNGSTYFYAYNSWATGEHTTIETTIQPSGEAIPNSSGSGDVQTQKRTTKKQFNSSKFLIRQTVQVETPGELLDGGSGGQVGSGSAGGIGFESETLWDVNSNGEVEEVREQQGAATAFGGADVGGSGGQVGTGTSTTGPFYGQVKTYDNTGGDSYLNSTLGFLTAGQVVGGYPYLPGARTNSPDARPQQAEVQQSPFYTETFPVEFDCDVTYDGSTILNGRIKKIDYGTFVFQGTNMARSAAIECRRLAGQFYRKRIQFPLTEEYMDAWSQPYDRIVVTEPYEGIQGLYLIVQEGWHANKREAIVECTLEPLATRQVTGVDPIQGGGTVSGDPRPIVTPGTAPWTHEDGEAMLFEDGTPALFEQSPG
jgi:hypothetical protein